MNQQTHSGNGHNIQGKIVNVGEIPRTSSDLSIIVNALSKSLFNPSEDDFQSLATPFDPELKIRYNNVVRFRSFIDDYKGYVGKLAVIYQEFDEQSTNKTRIVLETIKIIYSTERNALLFKHRPKNDIEIIREHADDLIEAVEQCLMDRIRTSSNIQASSEAIDVSLKIVLIDAFIRCKILEEPTDNVAA